MNGKTEKYCPRLVTFSCACRVLRFALWVIHWKIVREGARLGTLMLSSGQRAFVTSQKKILIRFARIEIFLGGRG